MRNKYISLPLHILITILASLFRGTTPKRIGPDGAMKGELFEIVQGQGL